MLRKMFFSTYETKIKRKGFYILIFPVLILLVGMVLHSTVKRDIVVPFVIGMSLPEAKAELDSVGLEYTIIEEASKSGVIKDGIILSQSPAHGSAIRKEEKVIIIVNQKSE